MKTKIYYENYCTVTYDKLIDDEQIRLGGTSYLTLEEAKAQLEYWKEYYKYNEAFYDFHTVKTTKTYERLD